MRVVSAATLRRTPLYERHLALGARMVDFAGWEMPINYPAGVVAEHLATRRFAGLFDVSHMGRFSVDGSDAVPFLQRVLSNDVADLSIGRSHYTLLANRTGGAIDDAYLYRFSSDRFLLVVNASNTQKDWDHLTAEMSTDKVDLQDISKQLAMISLQGPASEYLLNALLETGSLPEARRNALSTVTIAGGEVQLGRTGYTGEPLCFELFAPPSHAQLIWDLLVDAGAAPTGLGARDTLRLEAALPLYDHEQGIDPDGREIPVLSCPVTAYGVSLSSARGDFIGREALTRQQEAYGRIVAGDYSLKADLPRLIRPVAVTGRGIARAGSAVEHDGRPIGWVTSGTMVPYWKSLAGGTEGAPTGEHELRSICLAYLDSDLSVGHPVTIDIRGKLVEAVVVDHHLRSDWPPYARPVIYQGNG
jgi:aminomethyltransferase